MRNLFFTAICGIIGTALVSGFLLVQSAGSTSEAARGASLSQERPPNVVIIFTDDQGYGDLGSYGHPTIRTPNLDRMAAEGMRFTQFYSAASVCTPSRAALLTGRLPVRSGMASDRRRVLFPNSALGLPREEITIAEALKESGYVTAAIGKWHLGHLPEYLPTSNGFDSYFGIPYSNDMDRTVEGEWRKPFWQPEIEYWNVPLMRNEEIVERPAEQNTITKRYTEEAVAFMKQHRDEPFFLYLAHNLPHVPLFASDEFDGTSRRGLYGDVIEEIDWSVGQVLQTIRDLNLEQETLVFFTSDNGPWLIFDTHGGSAGLLRDGKGTTWEGGMRVPAIAWWPGTIPAGATSTSLASTLDFFPTALALSGAQAPESLTLDGADLTPVLRDPSLSIRDEMPFYRGTRLYAYRKGPWKAHFITQSAYQQDGGPVEHTPPALYHLEHDPSEQFDVAAEHPEVVQEIQRAAERHQATIQFRPTQLDSVLAEL